LQKELELIMGDLIKIEKSVGAANASNLPLDVGKIGAALVAIGPERGGIYAVPLSVGGLGEAIRQFQTFHKLPARDGRVDPKGKTLEKINQILNPGALPLPPSPIQRTGRIKYLPEMVQGMNRSVYSPAETSLTSDWVFKWNVVSGGGIVHYFELDEDVVPNWFGVLVPNGVTNFENIHLFFHPTPSNRHIDDKDYKTPGKGRFREILHYLTDDMAIQFCAAQSGQVLIMPLMTQGAAATSGILPQRWESIFGQILGQLASSDMSPSASPKTISSVVVSSFSNGITYSAAFRSRASLGSKLRGVIDFDGIISTYKDKSIALPHTALRFWQSAVGSQNVAALSVSNLFPLPLPRWQEPPYKDQFKGSYTDIMYGIHGTIPQKMMQFAAKKTAAR
jgi:hypothetical protein